LYCNKGEGRRLGSRKSAIEMDGPMKNETADAHA
jgi:hypothetical protein